jgi:hypothetical protein
MNESTIKRLLRLLVTEGQSTGHSPTQTGQRVGRFIASLERNPATTPEHRAKKRAQVNRIADRTSARQGELVKSRHPDLGKSDFQSRHNVGNAEANTVYRSRERFGKNYRAGKAAYGRDNH